MVEADIQNRISSFFLWLFLVPPKYPVEIHNNLSPQTWCFSYMYMYIYVSTYTHTYPHIGQPPQIYQCTCTSSNHLPKKQGRKRKKKKRVQQAITHVWNSLLYEVPTSLLNPQWWKGGGDRSGRRVIKQPYKSPHWPPKMQGENFRLIWYMYKCIT